LGLAKVEYKIGNVVSSIEAYEEACKLNPSNPDLWIQWATLYHDQGENDKAAMVIMSGLDEIPDNVLLNYYATIYLIFDGKFQQAFDYLENALILDFDGHTALFDFFPKIETLGYREDFPNRSGRRCVDRVWVRRCFLSGG